jgi:hypothetical protein
MLSGIICHDMSPKHDITSMDSQSEASTNRMNMNPDETSYFYFDAWIDVREQWLTGKAFPLLQVEIQLLLPGLFAEAQTECMFFITISTAMTNM